MTNKCTMFDNLNMSIEHNDKNGNNQTVKGLKINNIYGEYIDDNQECKQFWVNFTYKGYEFSRCIDLNSVERELKEDKNSLFPDRKKQQTVKFKR
jgi:hypothetical protein